MGWDPDDGDDGSAAGCGRLERSSALVTGSVEVDGVVDESVCGVVGRMAISVDPI